jgi:hypothetical protein
VSVWESNPDPSSAPIAENYVAPSTQVDPTLRTQVVHAPIVNEVVKKTIIEEVSRLQRF